jgi:phosphoglycolate phosphatase-like HAD superfamily hydrolase
VQRALTHSGHAFNGKNIVIIGDTEHDIRCGDGIGAFSVGVCTGHFTRADLECHLPDVLLDNLSDAPHFVRHVLHNAA